MTDENRPEANEEELMDAAEDAVEDPIGDETDGEAGPQHDGPAIESEEDIEEAEDEAEEEAEDEPDFESGEDEDDEDDSDVIDETAEEDQDVPDPDQPEVARKPRPPAKLERLQKILAQSGVASRRKAEEMIEQGRVQVNGKTVTELGTKADAGRDHIRVDGKLLHGAERLRYFVLNKPRGFVTTVKDPEGRPTVMQFFEKMRERLYPVGRLDYLSEGLLLVTNDGELANKLTRAAAGVEKTYLVKVSGIPSESELDVLRAGVAIAKGAPGSPKVRTSPARIRQVRQGDNPWYEVVLIEGRNRELRKMFEEIGHFVEKIRRVGYGPLILDQEPGNLRELDENELTLLRKAADGKLHTPKAKEIRRRNMIDSLPPEKVDAKTRGVKPGFKPAAGPKDYLPKKSFGAADRGAGASGPRKFGAGPARFGARPARFDAPAAESSAPRAAWKPRPEGAGAPAERGTGRPPQRFKPTAGSSDTRRPAAGGFGEKPAPRTFGDKPAGRSFGSTPAGKPAWKKPESGDRPAGKRPSFGKPSFDKPRLGKAGFDKPRFGKPGSGRPGLEKPTARPESTRRPAPEPFDDDEPRKSFKLHIEPVQDFDRSEGTRGGGARPSARPSAGRPPFGRSGAGTSGSGRPESSRSDFPRPASARPGSFRPTPNRSGSDRSGSARPGGLARPFTTSSGKPRPGGARPSSKPGKDGPRSFGSSAGRGSSATRGSGPAKRSFTPRDGSGREGGSSFRPRTEGSAPERRTGTGWKPKPSFGGKPGAGGGRPKPSGGAKSGFKPSGFKGKPGRKPGGKRPSGRRP